MYKKGKNIERMGRREYLSSINQIANIRWIMEKARELQKNIYFCCTHVPYALYSKSTHCPLSAQPQYHSTGLRNFNAQVVLVTSPFPLKRQTNSYLYSTYHELPKTEKFKSFKKVI